MGANLLYRFERLQYAEIRKKYVTGPTVQVGQEKEMNVIYGAEHFLRMLGTFCRLRIAFVRLTIWVVSMP